MLCLGSLGAQVEVNAHRRVKVTSLEGGQPAELPTVSVQALDCVAPGTDNGSLEFFLIPNENARVSAIVRNHELVFVQFEGPISRQRQDQVKELFGTRADDLETIREQEENLEAVIAADAIRVTRNQVKASIPEAAGRLYSWLATLTVDEAHWQSTAKVLSERRLP